ncbi:high affinity immunoglobulin alpha and immunoglobulin mu Fc receptor [Psammomys obesus]|uniref:high affinity immunoglobulin alpha and immunoglobulin mu Fc receptor n=1 Tax=Psammomys obesus TaxID=48139 RepID=UPI002452F766|nr:high affinity immunoglobulin alpha and immunoglobulin mu Fc receptor [Psammomys obesus]
MDQDIPAKPRAQKVTSLRSRWKILLLVLCLLQGLSMTPPHRGPHSRWLQDHSPHSRTHLYTSEAHTASTPPGCWKNSFTDANALKGPRLASGETGGAVTILCHYAPSSVNRHQRKYWCRLRPPLRACNTIVSTNHYTHHDYRGRVALTDFPQSALFMVRLFHLSLDDMGLYRCGIGDRNDMLFFSMNLIVSTGPSNSTYAAAPASGEPITASPRIASTVANRWTSGVTQIPAGRGSKRDRTAPTTGIIKTTHSASGGQTPRRARTTVSETSSREEGSVKVTGPTPESPAPKSRRMFSTTQGVWIWDSRNSVMTSTSSEGIRKGTTPEADGLQGETGVGASLNKPRTTTGTTRPSVLLSEPVTWETLQKHREASKQQTLYSMMEPSPAPSSWTLNTTHMEVESWGASTGGGPENTAEERSPSTESQLSAVGSMWVPGKGSSMKSAFTEEESNSWILTPILTALALVLLAALVLLKRRLWRERTSQDAERVPRITLIQMTHFLPDKLPDVGKTLCQDDLPPTQASLTVLEKDQGP